MLKTFWGRYGRAIVQTLAAGIVVLVPAFTGDHRIDPTEAVNTVIAVLAAAAVFTAPNMPGAPYVKTVLSFLTAAALGAVSLVNDGISWTDLGQILVAGLAAIGVRLAPSVSTAAGNHEASRYLPR